MHVDLEALWGKSSQDLRAQLCVAVDPAECFRILETALLARWKNALEEHPAVQAALEIFCRDAREAKVRDIAQHLGMSQRHFIKVFSDQVGVTPKRFARVQRFERGSQADAKQFHTGLGGDCACVRLFRSVPSYP